MCTGNVFFYKEREIENSQSCCSGDREYYYRALDRHFPGLSARYREKYRDSYEVVSEANDDLMRRFHEECEKRDILHTPDDCFRYINELPEKYRQMTIFDLAGKGT